MSRVRFFFQGEMRLFLDQTEDEHDPDPMEDDIELSFEEQMVNINS